MKIISKIAMVALVLSLSACSIFNISKMDAGEHLLGERLQVKVPSAWNHIDSHFVHGPNAQLWTKEGMAIDEMMFYTGVKDGEKIHPNNLASAKVPDFVFGSTMQPEQIAAMFEGMLARDGSTFKLVRLSPAPFAGVKGFRIEYSLIRKSNNVELNGIIAGAVDKGQLYAILYQAPRLEFFPRQQIQVMQIIGSARLKN